MDTIKTLHDERVSEWGTDVWNAVFSILDAEPDLDGESAGEAATAAERAVTDILSRVLSVDLDVAHARYLNWKDCQLDA